MGLLIDMINVGEGDSFLLTIDHPQGTEAHILIDAGLEEKSDDVLRFLRSYAARGLDFVIATHIDKDHIGGLKAVVQNFPVGEFVINVPPAFEKTWFGLRGELNQVRFAKGADRLAEGIDMVNDLLAELSTRKIKTSGALQGRSWTYGDVSLNVLNPTVERLALAWVESELLQTVRNSRVGAILGALADKKSTERPRQSALGNLLSGVPARPSGLGDLLSGLPPPPPSQVGRGLATLAGILGGIPPSSSPAPQTSPENDASIILEIVYKGEPYGLMTSDAGAGILKEITKGRRYTFVKVPHHGSETGLDKELIEQWKPSTAFVPVGENEYGHPALSILDLLRSHGVKTFCSSKTKDCRKDCTRGGFGNLCQPVGKAHPGWVTVDQSKCANNT